MSRSKRIPIIKDRPRNKKKSSIYWRAIRRHWKHSIKSGKLEFKLAKEIVNDYDYSDYKFISNNIKYTRK